MATPQPMENAQKTAITNFSDGVAGYLTSQILAPLMMWLEKEKDCKVTVKEMMAALEVPTTSKMSFSSTVNMPVRMPDLNAMGVSQMSTSAKRPKKIDSNNSEGTKCEYVFVRGNRKNQRCEEPCEPGQNRCKGCLKKGPGKSTTPLNPSGPPQPAQATGSVPPAVDTRSEVRVKPLADKANHFLSIDYGFIIQQLPMGALVAVGMDDSNNGWRPLTDEEKKLAESLKIGIVDPKAERSDEVAEGTEPGPTIPQISALAGPPLKSLNVPGQ